MLIKFLSVSLFFLLMMHSVHAQLCLGSLGDPIVNNGFGSGTNPGPSLPAATTNYQYSSTDCPNDGFYTVRNNTSACFGNSWHSMISDHTGNTNGYFMLVNASFQPGAFYVDTVRGLCGNTTYEFAAWVMNLILPSSCGGNIIQPNLTFNIERTDGSILQAYNTGNLPASPVVDWKQYGFFFTTPIAANEVVLRILNNAQGGCGNDLALDDITFRACGPQLTPSIAGLNTTTASLCEGIAANFAFTCNVSAGFNSPVFQWQQRINGGNWADISGQNATTISRSFPAFTPAGEYAYRLAVAEAGNLGAMQCRAASAPLTVIIHAPPVTSAINDGPLCEKNILTLTATGGTQYAWNGPNGFSANGSPLPLANAGLSQSGKYYVTVTSAAGCVRIDSTVVVVNPAPVARTVFGDVTICSGDNIQLIAGGGLSYKWLPSSGLSNADVMDPIASPLVTTRYNVIVSNQFLCNDTSAVKVNVVQRAVANAGPDRAILEGQKIQLFASVSGSASSYSWSSPVLINPIFSFQPFVSPVSDTKYILTVVSDSGCGISTDTILVKVFKGIFIPNAFSPNGDGVNDYWNIPSLAVYSYFELIVYNRWGQAVFYSNSPLRPWDGRFKGNPLPAGSYNYMIKIGKNQDFFKGPVLILR